MHVYFNGVLWFWFMVVFQRRLRSYSPAFSGNRRQCWCRANWVSFHQVRAWKSEWYCLEAKLPEGTMWFQESSVSALSLQIAVSSANYCQNQWNQLVFGSVCVCLCLVDYLQNSCKGSTLYGFKGGPAGIMKCKYVVLTPEYIYPYRNQVNSYLLS